MCHTSVYLYENIKLYLCLLCIREAEFVTIRVGDHDFENPTRALIEAAVDFFILHEDYEGSGSGGSDIALVKVLSLMYFACI